MQRSEAGIRVTVNSRADILIGVLAAGGERSMLALDTKGAEMLIEALTEACEAAREVLALGAAADAAAEGIAALREDAAAPDEAPSQGELDAHKEV